MIVHIHKALREFWYKPHLLIEYIKTHPCLSIEKVQKVHRLRYHAYKLFTELGTFPELLYYGVIVFEIWYL